jgi:acetyltransferase-like isoleucine patch superfamily enzyme
MPDKTASIVFRHPSALCESQDIGAGTHVWAFAHVMDGAVVGQNCNIGDHAFVEKGAIVGDRVTIKNGVMIWDGVTIENDAFVGPGVIFTNDRYPRSRRLAEAKKRYKNKDNWITSTKVLRGASIGAGAIILPGITIGRFATIAAGACVTHNVPNHALLVGHPAREVGWVCFCGMTLDGTLTCPDCNRGFRQQDNAIVPSE